MFFNYLKLSIRLLVRNPFFTTINVVGLAIGFASFYILWEYATSELRADQYHKDSERIARIGTNWFWSDDHGKSWGQRNFGYTIFDMFPKMSEDFPEIQSYVRFKPQERFTTESVNHGDRIIISIPDKNGQSQIFNETKVIYADSNLFNFFLIPLIHGRPEEVLREVHSVVLSESKALKYFGRRDPTGELIRLNDTITLKVSGVYKNLSHNTHLNFEMVISNQGLINKWDADLTLNVNGYVKLNHRDFKEFETKLNKKKDEYWANILRGKTRNKLDMFVQPLKEISFSQKIDEDNFNPKSYSLLFTLAFIALSVLVMAWINYVNLSVTRITGRFKEIGVRKVSGAGSSNMLGQFMTEALVTNVLAIGLACSLLQIVRTPVSVLFDIQIADFSSLSYQSVIIFLTIIIAGITVSGTYPAVIAMSFRPGVLFNLKSGSSGRGFIPSLLTFSQLTAAIIFILLGFTVSLQLRHILKMETGIDRDQVIIVDGPVVKPDNYSHTLSLLLEQISHQSNISAVTASRFIVNNTLFSGMFVVRRIGGDISPGLDANFVDEKFIPFYGLKLLAGRTFIKDDIADGVIVSRYAASRIGIGSPEAAVGAKVNIQFAGKEVEATIIGVIEDFRHSPFLNFGKNSSEMNFEGRGTILVYKDQLLGEQISSAEKISAKISSDHLEEVILSLRSLVVKQFPEIEFTWYFLDEKMNEVYAHERVARNQIVLFTVLALIIASLGLLGTISNKVVERTKELGIRKVLGAELHQIAGILLGDTAKQIAAATLLGIPVAYFLTLEYLDRFSEHINLQWWHFTLPVVMLVAILLITVSAALWKTAKSNPVEALKHE